MHSLTLGISPCPNDTFIFHGLISGRVRIPGLTFETRLADVEQLNALAQTGACHVIKLSLAAYPLVQQDYMLLDSGAALGRGVGPVLVRRKGSRPPDISRARLAVPGRLTTANLLCSLHGGFPAQRLVLRYDEVGPAVLAGDADLGALIHEGRFTYAEQGLELVEDLGVWWESTYGLPLPLGAIAARRDLGPERIAAVEQSIRDSLVAAEADIAPAWEYIRAHALELSESAIREHIRTFVTSFSHSLGPEGRTAVEALLAAARGELGLGEPGMPAFG